MSRTSDKDDRESRRKGRAQRRYEQLSTDREPFLNRAKDCARLTIPYLIPEDDIGHNETLPSLYQAVGANGVTNLASKLLMTMLPPNEPCFRLRVNNMLMEQEQEQVDKTFRTEIDKGLSRMEQSVLADIEEKGDRSVVFEGNQHLIVSGNGLYYDDPDDGLRFFPLSRFVVDRDPSGTPVEIIVRETISMDSMDDSLREQILTAVEGGVEEESTGEGESILNIDHQDREREKDVDIYTHLTRDGDTWNIYQEARGVVLEGSTGTYKADSCPWFPVRMYSIAGESYGRSFVELQLGDLTALESLSQALVEGSAISAFAVGLVNPNGITSARAVTEARNGDFLEGNADDVQFLQVQKGADLSVTAQQVQRLTTTLQTSFLMMEGVRRDGERVTAEEIRTIARELEAGLGGVYTLVSQEFQLPFIRSRMAHMAKKKLLPELPKGTVRPSVVTGFEALGRGNDKQKLIEFLQFILQTMGEQSAAYLNVPNAIQRLASAIGIPTEGLVKTEEDIQKEQQEAQQQAQQAQQMEMMNKLGPEVIRQIGNNAGALGLGGGGGDEG
nr:MAG TPA: Head to tail joining protein [Caudoviricetes sp.]